MTGLKSIPPKGVIFLLVSFLQIFAQHDNVPLDHDVYLFLKEMKVKGVIKRINDDNPVLSRYEIQKHLVTLSDNINELSTNEKLILKKYQDEFYDDKADSLNTFQFFGAGSGFSSDYSDFFSDKIKHTYSYRDDNASYYLEILGRALQGQQFNPFVNNSSLFDIGFRFRGTVIAKLGYSLTAQKGGIAGSQDLAPTFDPRLNYNFKYYERFENIGNYDFAEGYLRFYSEPADNMNLSFQIGREKLKLGYGYGSKLVLSGDHPVLDFIKMDFNYGVFSFTSLHASTIGEFHFDRELNYTKHFAYNRFKLSFDNLFDIGFGESIIYSGRGIDLAYLNPFVFYKYVEMSLQDRDNGLVFLDFQSNFLKNFEFQVTFFLDENILSQLQKLDLFSNKTAYQIGAFWYSPFSLSDLSIVLEYTRIRPYVYSHTNLKNSYTSHSQNLGHRIGPNADEIHASLSYNINEKMRVNFEFQHVRAGENIYDGQGNLIFNAGGDFMLGHRELIDAKYINFLDGERINQNIFSFKFRIEPIREVWFDLFYKYIAERNVSKETSVNTNFAYLRMMFNF
ncbi:MAG: capsule assembly Wzi family protein [Bacteroidota bacterium]